ncbi:hypothetical protein SEA_PAULODIABOLI_197 [Microbacterium phage PauloDiaboli]|nr:hypothetical protein SEA_PAULODIABOLI_197 [Microbacterium phage PauloDiaboli]QWY84005.1 hypothetical protein SEA_A3WALLY_198 [Microbacterium phage A3Wally]
MSKGDQYPTGWCMTGYHKDCTDFYLKQAYSRGCVCSCHEDSASTS